MLTYREARQALIDAFTHDIDAHQAGRYDEIGARFDELDAVISRDQGPEFDKLLRALTFWDQWTDARNHEWLYYDGINESDWPVLAKRIVASLEAD